MKDKILNIVIVILVLIVLFMCGNILYTKYLIECENYNDSIVDIVITVIKGEKTKNDILVLDVNESIKNNFINYIENSFYVEDELILVYEDISSFNHIETAKQIYNQLEESGTLNYNGKQTKNLDSFDFLYGELDIFLSDVFTDEEIIELYTLRNLIKGDVNSKSDETSSDIVVKDNNLYVSAYNLRNNLNNRKYNGFDILINEFNDFSFTKKFKEDLESSDFFIKYIIEIEKNKLRYVIEDLNGLSYNFIVELKGNKICNVIF